jgi:hypothetical protein
MAPPQPAEGQLRAPSRGIKRQTKLKSVSWDSPSAGNPFFTAAKGEKVSRIAREIHMAKHIVRTPLSTGAGSMNSEPADVEGLDEDRDLGDFPIDTLLIRNETRTAFEVVRRIEGGGYIMNPDFQRDFIWDREKQSKLIESVVMRIPLPVFYLAEDPQGKIIVVDGLQRLSTFQAFLANKFALKLPEQQLLNGKRFRAYPSTEPNGCKHP